MGRRIAKKVNGAVTEKYLWQGLTRLLAVYDGSNNLLIRFIYADGRMPVSMMKSGTTYYLAYDQIGSLRAVLDASGTVIKEQLYDSFGAIIYDSNSSFTVPFGFAGGLHDRDTGLVRFGFRDYDPNIGRWTAKDPIDFKGGDTNLFNYVTNDPIRFYDPTGRTPLWFEIADVLFEIWMSLFGHVDPLNPPDIEDEWIRDRDREDLYRRIDQLEQDLPALAERLDDLIRDLERRRQWERDNGVPPADPTPTPNCTM